MIRTQWHKKTDKITGEIIRELREKQKLTRKYMATMLGIDPRTYARIERGEARLTLAEVKGIVMFFKINSDVLFPYL